MESKPRFHNGFFAIGLVWAWYDLWIGFFWSKQKRRLYVLPLPCVGVYFEFSDSLEYGYGAESEKEGAKSK